MDEDQLNYLLQSSYLPSDTGFQIGQFGPNQNYLGKGMRGVESLGIGPNLNYLGDGPMTGSIGVGPNQNYLGKGMQIGSMGQPRYDSGTQTIFPSNILPALSDLGGITPSYGVANEEDVEQEFLPGQKKSGGITDLFKALIGFAVPGANFFLNQGSRAMDGIRSLNQRIRNTDFAKSSSLADYFDAKSYGGRDARDRAAEKTMREARAIQKQVDMRPSAIQTNQDKGRGNRPGGANYSAPSRPSRSSGFSSSARGKALHG